MKRASRASKGGKLENNKQKYIKQIRRMNEKQEWIREEKKNKR